MLKRVTSFLWLVFLLAAAFAGAWIVVDNTQPVEFVLFVWSFPEQSLGLLVLVVFISGLLVGLLGNLAFTSWMAFKLKRLQMRKPGEEGKTGASPASPGKTL